MSIQDFQLQIVAKNPCRIASTGNLGLTGLAAIDGVTPVAGNRVLAKDQTTGSQNGIYIAAAGAWTRARDYDTTSTGITAGIATFIQEGTANAKKTYVMTTSGAIVVGTTVTVWEETGGGGTTGTSVVKDPVRVATSGNITLVGGAPNSVDGVTLVANNRILVWNQTTGSQNGLYEVTTLGTGANGTWSRTTDFDDAVVDAITAGNEVYVQEGDTFGRVKFLLTTTGTITIGATSLEFIPMGGLVRTDASSTEIQASTTFATTTQWTSSVNMRDHNEIAIWFDPIDLNAGGVTTVTLVIAWSDDGSTIPFSAGEYNQKTDYDITNQTDGSFKALTYTASLTAADGTLVQGVGVHLSFPKRGGYCRIGVLANENGTGDYTVRSQRLVT